MAFRGADQFLFMLTSDASQDVYPENKSSSFRVLLKEPIDVGDDDWEVALLSINYPFSWTNVGPSAKVRMKFYVGSGAQHVQEISFPDWQCQSMTEVIQFMTKDNLISQHITPDSKVWLRLDELGRFKLTSMLPGFDVGFSDNMLKLLGLAGHEKASSMSMRAFERRQRHRNFLNHVWAKDKYFDYGDKDLKTRVLGCESLREFWEIVGTYVNGAQLDQLYDKLAYLDEELKREEERDLIDEGTRNRRETNSVIPLPIEFDEAGENVAETRVGKVLMMMMRRMKLLMFEDDLPKTIKGVTPGNLNPVQRMWVYMNIIEPVDMNDSSVKLLKLVNTRGQSFRTTQEEFTHPTYLSLKKGKHSMIEVQILGDSGDPVPFQSGTVVLTLHFQKVVHRFKRRLGT